MGLSFVIESWAACAPGVDTPLRWSQWAAAPWLPEGEPQVSLAAVAPMLRRRFAPLGRLAAQVAIDLAGPAIAAAPAAIGAPGGAIAAAPAAIDAPGGATLAADADLDDQPTVYASRYGETSRCLELLAEQARGNPLSPTAFGLSVHNAIGAMIALTRGDRRNSSAIAAGRATAAAGVAEALGLLEDGAARASLIVYDAPLPADYAQFQDEPCAHFAFAWNLRRPRAGERALHLEWRAADGTAAPAHPHLPASLQALWFGLSDARELTQAVGGRHCTWSRDA
jgi:hypothetical protein